jgi:DNA adenine methylase
MARTRSNPFIKPYLKWAGGKRQLLPEIKKFLPDNLSGLRYFEPFVGAGALFFELQPRRAVISDNNEQLILTYKVIRDDVDSLIAALNAHKNHNCESYFYNIRGLDRNKTSFAALSNVQKAARLIYLNKTCYNGLYRVNAQGLFNAPYGRYKNPDICSEPVLRSIQAYLNRVGAEIEITDGDFENTVCGAERDSFVYFDPPYHSPDNTNFTGYQANGFSETEQIRLCNVFAALTEKGVRCLLSNSDTQFIRDLYKDKRYDIVTVKAKRAINSDSAGRGDVNEVLVKNWR